ncbi:MAG: thioredoxin family protein [Planctomycetaceae bacterium]|nr:thioredoxin family protein [Planctomycetaceae bacterium]
MNQYAVPLLFLFATSIAAAGEYNPVLSIGDEAPAWKDLPEIDGKKHSLAGLKDHDAVVVVFTCNSCPYSVDYEDRVIALTKSLTDRNVALIAINVNKVPEDSFQAMKERAVAKGFSFPYLYDDTQQIARDYGATYTPEFFVLDGDRKIAYMGALDDSPDASKVQKRHVANAVTAVLSREAPKVTETIAIGCRIRLERQRRRRKQ